MSLKRGLCLTVPAADAIVGAWRVNHDPISARALPAHVTVRAPFPAGLQVTPEAVAPLVNHHLPLPLTLSRLENRPGALVVLVEPDDALRALTEAFDAVVDGLPPHREGRPDLAYHVTVVRTADEHVRAAATGEIAPSLPLDVRASDLCLFEWDDEQLRVVWRLRPE